MPMELDVPAIPFLRLYHGAFSCQRCPATHPYTCLDERSMVIIRKWVGYYISRDIVFSRHLCNSSRGRRYLVLPLSGPEFLSFVACCPTCASTTTGPPHSSPHAEPGRLDIIPIAQSLQASINTEYGTPPTSEFSTPLRVVILMLVPDDAIEIGRRN